MDINLCVTIDDQKIERSYECEHITHINWNEIMSDLYDEYEDIKWADDCEEEKESERNADKLK